ncbi:MAG: DMT family transporter [Peptostreptococcaceae bacterium]|nr:DMT family transporter [Peptostreptococcaceae bacterium]
MKKNRKIYLLMVFAALCWSGAFIAGKLSVPYIPPFTLTFLRFLFATIILYVIKKKVRIGENYLFKREDLPVFLFTGIVGMVFYHAFFFTALKYTTAINSSIIAAMNPIFTVIIAYLFVKQKITKRMLLGIVISFAGVVLTITSGKLDLIITLNFNRGDILMLTAVISWAAYSVFSKSKGGHIPAMALTYYSFLVCTIVCIPLVIWDKPWEWIHHVPFSALWAVLYMSLFASVIGYLIQQIAIKEIGPSRTSIFINLVPVFSIVLSVLILGETLELIKIFTAAVIIIGVYICQTVGRK